MLLAPTPEAPPAARPGILAPEWLACAAGATLGLALLSLASLPSAIQWLRFPSAGLTPSWATLGASLSVVGSVVLLCVLGVAHRRVRRATPSLAPGLAVAIVASAIEVVASALGFASDAALLHVVRSFPYLAVGQAWEALLVVAWTLAGVAALMVFWRLGADSDLTNEVRAAWQPFAGMLAVGFALQALARAVAFASSAWAPDTHTAATWCFAGLEAASYLLLASAFLLASRARRRSSSRSGVTRGFPVAAIGFVLLAGAELLGAIELLVPGSDPQGTVRLLTWQAVGTVAGWGLLSLAAVVALGTLLEGDGGAGRSPDAAPAPTGASPGR